MIRLATTERKMYIRYHSMIVSAIKSTVNIYLKIIHLNRITVKCPKFHAYLSILIAYFV